MPLTFFGFKQISHQCNMTPPPVLGVKRFTFLARASVMPPRSHAQQRRQAIKTPRSGRLEIASDTEGGLTRSRAKLVTLERNMRGKPGRCVGHGAGAYHSSNPFLDKGHPSSLAHA